MLRRMDPYLKRLFKYFLAHKIRLALAGVFLLGSASSSSITATLLGKLTDLGFYEQQTWVIIAAPAALILVTAMFALCTVMSSYLMAKVSQSVLIKVRTQLFSKLLHWPAPEYQSKPSGLVSSKFVNESALALSGAAESIIIMVRDCVQVAALMAVLFWHNWQLTLVTFIVAPGLILTLRLISRRMKKIVKASQEAIAGMISRVQESYSAERIVKISNTYEFEEDRFGKVNDDISRFALKSIKMSSLSTPLTQMLTMIAVAFVVGVALLEAQKGLLTIGEFITFLSALLLMKAPIQHLAGLNATFASISVAAKSIFDMMDTELEQDKGTKTLGRAQGNLTFSSVSLRYPGTEKDALSNVSFEVKAGEHIALVGESGAGKSTIVNLIPRFLDVTAGHIYLDGIDTAELTLESLRNQIAIVPQEPILIEGTIRDNITYGKENAAAAEVQKAVEASGLTEFIASLPKGLDSDVGESGKQLSGGQRQRIAIARAVLKDAPILILDEATSALDSKTQHEIKEAFSRLMKGRTCISVIHQMSAIDESYDIYVMRDGEIVEHRKATK